MYDLIIIGGGPAALTAGIYGARKKLKILILAQKPSWQMSSALNIENYPGFKSISGVELLKKMREQVAHYKVEFKEEQVKKVELVSKKEFAVTSNKGEYRTKIVIAASGKTPRKLNVNGEKKFTGKGLSYCPTCDGPLFSGKNVAVIGGGNAGLEAALELTSYANKVYILEFLDRFSGDEPTQEKLKNSGKVEFILSAEVKEIKGNGFVNTLIYKDKKKDRIKILKVEGIFVEIGSVPVSDFVEDLVELNKGGEIIVDSKTNMTRTPGLFAAGDVTDVPHKQIIIACGEGAKAALSAYYYLFKRE
ncbi:MAG: hypothetical protein COV69_01860 [Parcubacteria group bacterium CG11_big_fil_rev_8_21_14_0_20_39_14]|nr:MAG: hypothetical protein COV69_01860 [Parcubacteria group bacterium CG11_big_fil_rev_8_21_14_0_20_39_14]PIS35549.1 MAG: hypothetical protein COT36_01785 [Parcubacteria group bacterium CG08_land_8_20_14_0_20_38_56]